VPLTPEQKRAYQREYIAKRRNTEQLQRIGDLLGVHVHSWHQSDDGKTVTCDCGATERHKPGRPHNLYTDGLPDWPELLRGVPTKAADRLLERINTKSR
jgi:hypothetical protein